MNATTANPKKAQSRWWRHTARAVVIALIAVLVPGTPAVHADDTTVAGVCALVDLEITTNLTRDIPPGGPSTITFEGDDIDCDLAGTADFSGTVTGLSTPTHTTTCAGGVASGTGDLTIFGTMTASFAVHLVMVGPLVVMVLDEISPAFVGVGVFADTSASTPDCVLTPPQTGATWTGNLFFARP